MDTPTPYTTYAVAGMTCNHCVMSVREEIAEIPGVRDIDIDLTTGRLAVAGQNVTDAAIAAAVAAAGYQVIA
jgi:copper chaperone